ncbi:MAG TPA: site-2 protease family protein [Tepidiformaceae bacterium]
MRHIRLGALFGIPILIHPLWFIIFGLTTLILAREVYPSALEDDGTATHVTLALASAVLFFASILLHELAHSLVARVYAIPVKSITLFLFGGVAQITRDATKPLNELLMALAGPATSMLLALAFFAIWALTGGATDRPLEVMLIWLGLMNGVLAVFNMLPAFPMDGGRVFRSAVWLVSGSYHRATSVAAWTGRGFAWAMMTLGFLWLLGFDTYVTGTPVNGGWMILIGLFLENAARQSLAQNRFVEALGKYRAGDLMVSNPPVVEGNVSVAALARGVLELNPRVCYFVERDGKLAGIISAYQMRAVPEAMWDATTAAQAMVPSERLHATSPDDRASDVLMAMETEELLHMPVVSDGRVVGVISRDRLISVLRQSGLVPA